MRRREFLVPRFKPPNQALRILRLGAELQASQLRDLHLQMFDLGFSRQEPFLKIGNVFVVLSYHRCVSEHQSLQGMRIIGQYGSRDPTSVTSMGNRMVRNRFISSDMISTRIVVVFPILDIGTPPWQFGSVGCVS